MTKYNYTTKNLYACGMDIPYEKPFTKEESTKFANQLRFDEFKRKFLEFLTNFLVKFLQFKGLSRDTSYKN